MNAHTPVPAQAAPRGGPDLVDCAASIIAAYVAHNAVPPAELPGLLGAVHGALAGLGRPAAPAPEVFDRPNPERVRRSIRPDGLVSFIDGRSYKTLKRHLTAHGLTPERYRERYGLAADYPMAAADYVAARSAMAKAIGLGALARQAAPEAAAA